MGQRDPDVPPITARWPVADIVYVAIMGPVMLAAFLEWFLWLAAFLYCLVKVFQKAENWMVRLLAVLMMVSFTALRGIFLPVMIVTLPLPARVTQYFPKAMVSFLQWFAFWTFSGLLTIPCLFCIYQLVTNSIGRQKRIRHVLDERSAPKVVIVMPCYKEVPDTLITAVNSVVDCDYPPSCLHVFLSFDGDQEDDLYMKTIEKLGVPLIFESYPRSIDVTYRSTRVTVSRFPHGGKRQCQKRTFRLIDKIYAEYLKQHDNLFILFIDSDCILDRVCIQNFIYEMELKPGSKHNMLAMTGVITSTTEKNTFITLLQDMEYIHGQLFERSVESGCGSVTCLPGALTILRFSAFRKMARYYFADKAEQCDDLFDYGKCHLGEDRWLTHLFMIGADERYQIQMCTGAFCKTEAVQSYRSLLKQRRRWFLGFITNEVCMLTDGRLWRKYPILCMVRFMQNTIRTTALLFFIMVLSIITTSNKVKNLPVGFIAVSLGLNWLLMFYFGLRLRRYKAWLYPIMFVVNPFFNWVYMVYGIFTAGQRTWGGPRADAGAADTATSVQQAVAHAEATGDDLNVVPESFRQETGREHSTSYKGSEQLPLQPLRHHRGDIGRVGQVRQGFPEQSRESLVTLPDFLPRNADAPHVPLHPRYSSESLASNDSTMNSVHLPRRVESMMIEGERVGRIVDMASPRESSRDDASGGMPQAHRQDMFEYDPAQRTGVNRSVESLSVTPTSGRHQRQSRSRRSSYDNAPLGVPLGAVSPLSTLAALTYESEPEARENASGPELVRPPAERRSGGYPTTGLPRSPLGLNAAGFIASEDSPLYTLQQEQMEEHSLGSAPAPSSPVRSERPRRNKWWRWARQGASGQR